ncbi:Aldehyde dehydrogenase family 9 member A1-B [Trichoplax sp. H2]|nr:Aldehyde dehydrogenase family 9 member A1-B [Trichoplax sp. H2]|eukprot:RDD43494.1 Aldehyde dehydrogenase family 9 member A1-B [Trichoplax sp. H2]
MIPQISVRYLSHSHFNCYASLINKLSLLSRTCSSASDNALKLNYINGQRCHVADEAEERFKIREPATNKLIGNLSSSGPKTVNDGVKSALSAFPEWSAQTSIDRGRALLRISKLLRQRNEEIARLEVRDTGKPISEARCDVESAAECFEYFGGIAATLSGQHFEFANGSFAYTKREPLGVCVGIGAWNFPIQIVSWKTAPALACGNTIVYKPSQMTPMSSSLLGDIITEAGLPLGCYNVVQGGSQTGRLLCEHPSVAKVSFTGSVPVGKKIMSYCSSGVKHSTIELGGKSPLIVFPDSDIENAVSGTLMANFLSQGQVCSNAARVYIHDSIIDDFVTRLMERTKKMIIGDPFKQETQVGALISEEHYHRVKAYIDQAVTEGARIRCGGERVVFDNSELAGGFYMSPCVLDSCHDDMTIVKEEVFGPVVSILSFKDEEEVLERANNTVFGLSAGVFTKDIQRAHRVIAKLQAGSCWINNYNIYPTGFPFGGYKESGIGRENCAQTLNHYSQLKTVYVEMGDVDCPF